MTNHIGTQSRHGATIKNATQSSLSTYIQAKTEVAKNMGLTYSPLTQGVEYIHITHSHTTVPVNNNFIESLKQGKSGIIENPGTHSIFSNKGITHSHTKPTLDFKTQSSNNGLKIENGKITYNNPMLIKGTQSGYTWATNTKTGIKSMGKNAMAHQVINGTNSNSKFGFNVGTASFNKTKIFYAKTNSNTKKIALLPFVQFVEKICNNAETMIKTRNVTINGNIITDINHVLISGDIVRVGIGHYLNNSDQIAIVT